MHVRRTHGIGSGILLVLLGAWVAAVPYVGPHFHYSVGATETWHWTAGRVWLSLVPGVVTIVAGAVLVVATRRGTLVVASSVAASAGIWIVIGPQTSLLWHGTMQAGPAAGGVHRRLLEVLGYSLLSGCLIAVVASFTLGRSSVASVEDVRHDLEVRQQGLGSVAGLGTRWPCQRNRSMRLPLLDPTPAARAPLVARRLRGHGRSNQRSSTSAPQRRRPSGQPPPTPPAPRSDSLRRRPLRAPRRTGLRRSHLTVVSATSLPRPHPRHVEPIGRARASCLGRPSGVSEVDARPLARDGTTRRSRTPSGRAPGVRFERRVVWERRPGPVAAHGGGPRAAWVSSRVTGPRRSGSSLCRPSAGQAD